MRGKALMTVLGLALVAATPAPTAPVTNYLVSLKIFDGNRLAASPSLTTAGHEPATFLLRDVRQSLEIIAFPKVAGDFHVNTSLVQWTPNGMFGSDQARLIESNGRPESILLEKFDLATHKVGKVRVEVTISSMAPKSR